MMKIMVTPDKAFDFTKVTDSFMPRQCKELCNIKSIFLTKVSNTKAKEGYNWKIKDLTLGFKDIDRI